MQIEGTIQTAPHPCLMFTTAEPIPDTPLIVMMGQTVFREKAQREQDCWRLPIPEEVAAEIQRKQVEAWLCPEDDSPLLCLNQALREALLANRSACYFFLMLDAAQQERFAVYVEEGDENDRIRRIDKVVAMLYERRVL